MRPLLMGILTLIFFIVFFVVGGYFTLQHPKQKYFKTCYGQKGHCVEEYNCEDQFKSDYLTLCVMRRKICCLPKVSMKSGITDYE